MGSFRLLFVIVFIIITYINEHFAVAQGPDVSFKDETIYKDALWDSKVLPRSFKWRLSLKEYIDFHSPRLYVTMFCIFIGSILASAAGIGGGGVFVALLMFAGHFNVWESVPLSKAMIFTGSLISGYLNIRKRHPLSGDPIIDMDIVRMIVPGALCGTYFGVFLNGVLNEIVIVFLLFAILSTVTIKTFKSGIQAYKEENPEKTRALEMLPDDSLSLPRIRSQIVRPLLSYNAYQTLQPSRETPDTVQQHARVVPLPVQSYMFKGVDNTHSGYSNRRFVEKKAEQREFHKSHEEVMKRVRHELTGKKCKESIWRDIGLLFVLLIVTITCGVSLHLLLGTSSDRSSGKFNFWSLICVTVFLIIFAAIIQIFLGFIVHLNGKIISKEKLDDLPPSKADVQLGQEKSFLEPLTPDCPSVHISSLARAYRISHFTNDARSNQAYPSSESTLKYLPDSGNLSDSVPVEGRLGYRILGKAESDFCEEDNTSITENVKYYDTASASLNPDHQYLGSPYPAPVGILSALDSPTNYEHYDKRETEQACKWPIKLLLAYPAVSFVAGILSGLLGIGGGLIFSPFMVTLDVEPVIAVATAATCVIFTSSSTTFQYLLIGRVIIPLALMFGAVTIVASYIGVRGIHYISSKYGKKSHVIFIVGTAVGVSSILTIAKVISIIAKQ